MVGGGGVKSPKIFSQMSVAPKGVETFQNDMFSDCRRFIRVGQYETSAFWGLVELFTKEYLGKVS